MRKDCPNCGDQGEVPYCFRCPDCKKGLDPVEVIKTLRRALGACLGEMASTGNPYSDKSKGSSNWDRAETMGENAMKKTKGKLRL